MELFDYKPELYKQDGKTIKDFLAATGQVGGKIIKPISKFSQHGESGAWVSDLLPNIAKISDELAFIKSMTSPSLQHLDAQIYHNTGSIKEGSPFIGSWVSHIFGAKNPNTPCPFVMTDPNGYPRSFNKFITPNFLNNNSRRLVFSKVTRLKEKLEALIYSDSKNQRQFLETLNALNALHNKGDDPLLNARSELFNLAYKLNHKFSKNLSNEYYDRDTQKLYGVMKMGENHYADQLIYSRFLVEEEAPYIQIISSNEKDPTSWDHHFKLGADIRSMCLKVDRPIYGFIKDLKKRSLLDQNLILWSGEFGRLPIIDDDTPDGSPSTGRGHNNMAGTAWFAGAGIKKGITLGETDELSLRATKDKVDPCDLWATVFHLMGVDHKELSFSIEGNKHRLTTDQNKILKKILI